MSEIRLNGVSSYGTTNPATIGAGATTIFWLTAPPGIPTITSPDYVKLTLDPDTTNAEVVYLGPYTSGATSGTVTRLAETVQGGASSAIAHTSVQWMAAPSAADFEPYGVTGCSPSGDTTGATDYAAITAVVASFTHGGRVLLGAGTYYVNAPIVLPDGVQLFGAGFYSQQATTPGTQSTQILAGSGWTTTNVAVTATTTTGSPTTVTTAANHGLAVGQWVLLTNVNGINGAYQVATVPTSTTFTITTSNHTTYTGGGNCGTGWAVVCAGTATSDQSAGAVGVNIDANSLAPRATFTMCNYCEWDHCNIANGTICAFDIYSGASNGNMLATNCINQQNANTAAISLAGVTTTNGSASITVPSGASPSTSHVGYLVNETNGQSNSPGATIPVGTRVQSVTISGGTGTYVLTNAATATTTLTTYLIGGMSLNIGSHDWCIVGGRMGRGMKVLAGGGNIVTGGHWTHGGGTGGPLGPNILLLNPTLITGTFIDSSFYCAAVAHPAGAGSCLLDGCRTTNGGGGSNGTIPFISEASTTDAVSISGLMMIISPASNLWTNLIDAPNAFTSVNGVTIDNSALSGSIYGSGSPGSARGVILNGVAQADLGASSASVSSLTAGTSPYTFPALSYNAVYILATAGGLSALTLAGQTVAITVGIPIFVPANRALVATWTTTAPVFKVIAV